MLGRRKKYNGQANILVNIFIYRVVLFTNQTPPKQNMKNYFY